MLTALEKLPADRFATRRGVRCGAGDPSGRASSATRSRPAHPGARGSGAIPAPGSASPPSAPRRHGRVDGMRSAPVARHQPPGSAALEAPDPVAAQSRGHVVASQAAIAPDGSSLVYTDSTDGGFMLMRKPRDASSAVPMAGTEGGVSPFFSPDGRWVGYLTLDGRLERCRWPAGARSPWPRTCTRNTSSAPGWTTGRSSTPRWCPTLRDVPADGGAATALMQRASPRPGTSRAISSAARAAGGFCLPIAVGTAASRPRCTCLEFASRQRPPPRPPGRRRLVLPYRPPVVHQPGWWPVRGAI